ncbi:MAG: ABC transporter permease [Nitrososphaeraceae archaeon]|nr:ABC transporter permease [Nitrososphaeraceae archaeon]MBV9667263.1 ABC transporter permease [Nitrososphaeraceae archaeon]
MNIRETFIFSFESLRDRKLRTILTILMVMSGSALLVAVSGIGASFSDSFNKQIRNLAPNILFISSSQQAQGGGGPGIGGGTPTPPKITLNSAVVNRIHSLPLVTDVISTYRGSVTLQSQSESKNGAILSMDPQKLRMVAPTLEFTDGSTVQPNNPAAMIVAQDVANPPGDANPFLVLGQSVRATYSFVDADTGRQKEQSKNFIITGIMKETGNPTIDNGIVINLQAGNSLLQKSGKFDSLFVIAQSADAVDIVEQEIRDLYSNNIGINTVKAILKTIQQFTGGINAFLSSIAIVSLIVGAVGIITTLYTAVVERTREIGTLKAIGAQNRNILALFLVEALLIGIFGATLGLLSGIGFGYALSAGIRPGNGAYTPPIFLASDMFRVWMISVGLSIIAGLFPALKASRLLPIAALRSQ